MATKLSKIVADFRTSLATKIAVGGTTATLQSATDDDGVSLPAGQYFFTLDGDNPQKEHIVCTLSGTSLSSIKSITRQGVQSSGAVREHRIGSSVTITNFAHIKYINDLLDGTTNLNASLPLEYDATASITTANQLATKDYVDGVAIAGGADASTTVKGISKLSTAPASATDPIAVGTNDTRIPTQDENNALVGTSGTPSTSNKYVTADDATATPTADKIVRADGSGKIDDGWLNTPAVAVDKQIFTSSNTWTKPSGVTTVQVVVIGAGGGGGSGVNGGGVNDASGGTGGGGGGVKIATFNASDLGSTETVTVGAGGGVSTGGGSSSFGTWLTAYGGGGGLIGASSPANKAGGGGAGTGGNASSTTGGIPTSASAGIGGQGVSGASGTDGVVSEWGGASGGGAQTGTGNPGKAGGSSLFAAPGGGSGGTSNSGGAASSNGGAGGTTGTYTVGGGGAGGIGSTGNGTAGTAGSTNATLAKGYTGSGGGGGAGGANASGSGGNGGAGGAPGAGGGGGGGCFAIAGTPGTGGTGGRGEVRVYSW